ncbi:MAG: OmpA family protein [Chitinispirillaceae bacterium]|nr:OmpA family protein [Chitinispirillaceae bacterium]
MIEKRILSRDLAKKISDIKPGETYKIIIKKLKRRILEMEDIHFHHNSAVFLPGAIDDDPQKGLSGIAVLSSALKHAKKYPDDKLLIAGHTDTSGENAYNAELSMLRAESVLACLEGNKDNWIELCLKKSKVEDYQFILKWFTTQIDWHCDPGKIDNIKGNKTTDALKSFQSQYNSLFNASITVDGVIGKQTWGAIFDIYTSELRKQLSVSEEQLAEYRSLIVFVDSSKKTAGCGESHPIEEKDKDNFRSNTNRRVELLFFNTGEEPSLSCNNNGGCDNPQVCEIYKKNCYDPVYIDIDGKGSFSDLIIQWPENLSENMPQDLTLTAKAGDVSVSVDWTQGTVVDTMRQFIFNRLPFKKECTLTGKSSEKELILWNSQFIHDKDNPPTFEHFIEEFLSVEEQTLTDVPDIEKNHVEDTYGSPYND